MAAFQKLMVVEPHAAKQTVVAIKYVDVARLVVAFEPHKKETTSAFAFHQMGYRFQSNLEPDVLPVRWRTMVHEQLTGCLPRADEPRPHMAEFELVRAAELSTDDTVFYTASTARFQDPDGASGAGGVMACMDRLRGSSMMVPMAYADEIPELIHESIPVFF
jgi:hypothetical protein